MTGKRGPISNPKSVGHREHPALVAVASAPAKIPPVPVGLQAGARKAWKVYWNSPVAAVTDEVDLPAITRLFSLYSQHEEATAMLDGNFLVKGSVGQARINPLADHLLKLENTILRLENELGLTPMARMRLGIAVGAAQETLDKMNERFAGGQELEAFTIGDKSSS